MKTTIQLLAKALKTQKAAQWCRDLDINESAIAQAKRRGRLSPTMAGGFAIRMGEDPAHWVMTAAIEAEPETTMLTEVKRSIKQNSKDELEGIGPASKTQQCLKTFSHQSSLMRHIGN